MGKTLDLTVRYFQDSPGEGLPYREEHFIRRETDMSLPVEQTALVLVDTWDNHFITSWLERAVTVMREAVVPALEAARSTRMLVVHAPSPRVTPSYPGHMARHRTVVADAPSWPPAAFHARQGQFEAFRGPRAQPPGVPDVTIGMSPLIDVRDNEELLETGEQLHELCEKREILHLIYAGFATNWCILGRNYGMRAMAARGYNLILLREATTGVEYPDTLDGSMATELAIREAETQLGFSVDNEGFLAACVSAKESR